MKSSKLSNMVRGWFVGDFSPTAYKTRDVEVGVKEYKAGDHEVWHCHKIATELTVLITGKVRMNDSYFVTGDIVTIPPGEGTDFEVLEDTITVVVKLPGAIDDKYVKDQ